jgi:CysZ protein
MIEAAAKAFFQMFSAPFRRVMLKAIGLALLVLIVLGIALHRLLAVLIGNSAGWATGTTPALPQWGWDALAWLVSFAAGLGIAAGALFLMPAVAALVGSFFVDEIADIVESTHYPNEPPGQALSFWRALIEGIKTALLAIAVYICAAPLLLFAGLGFIALFLANAYLLGREYFLLAAMRFRTPSEARALRRVHRSTVFLAGMIIALVVSIPVVNFVTPIFAMAFMVHMHKRLSPNRTELIPPSRPVTLQ